jgi:hypothetical protein
MPEKCAYAMTLMLNTLPRKDKKVPPEQAYLADGLHKHLYSYYDELKKIAIDPVREARRSQAEDEENEQKLVADKLKRLRQIAKMKQPRTPEGHVQLRFQLDSIDNPEVEIACAQPEEFSHAIDLLAAEDEEETLTFHGKVTEIDEASGIVMVRADNSLTFIQVPQSLRNHLKPGARSGFRVREKANTAKVNVYTLLDILDDEGEE